MWLLYPTRPWGLSAVHTVLTHRTIFSIGLAVFVSRAPSTEQVSGVGVCCVSAGVVCCVVYGMSGVGC